MTTITETNWRALGLSYEPKRGAYKRIGWYRRPDGKIVNKLFYLGHEPLIAHREKEKLEAQWQKKRAEAKELRRLSGMKTVPLWNADESIEKVQERGTLIDLPPGADDPVYEETPPQQILTIVEAQKRFFENYGERIGLAGRRGIIQNTYNGMSRLLPRALAPFPPATDLSKLTYRDFERFCNHWCRKPVNEKGWPCADRTVHDYLRRTLQFFDWLENRPDLTFQMPKGARRLMKDSMLGLNAPSDFEYFSLDELKDIMAAAPDRTKLYILIALNTGHLNVDIATIYFDYAREGVISKLVLDADQPYLLKTRWKNRRKFKTPVKHYLWPETVAYMNKFLNPDAQPENLCFLNETGGTLYREIKNGSSFPHLPPQLRHAFPHGLFG